MIRFPETAWNEWAAVEYAAESGRRLRKRIEHDTEVERAVERLRVRHEAAALFQQEVDADLTPTLEMMTLADYRANPAMAPEDIIDGVVKSEGMCIVIGPSGSGKSTLAFQMLHSMSTGADWLGQSVKPVMGSVGVVSYDMDAAMVFDWMSGYPNMDPAKVSVINAYKRGNPLGVPKFREQIIAEWKAMNVETIVIDSFSASFFGHDQNDAAATMAHYRDLKLFALTEVGAKSLIVIAHSTLSSPEKIRGSSVHHDVADSIVGVTGTQAEVRSIHMVKYRAAKGQKQMADVLISAPDDVTHLVSVNTGQMALNGMAMPPNAGHEAFAVETNEDPEIQNDDEPQEGETL